MIHALLSGLLGTLLIGCASAPPPAAARADMSIPRVHAKTANELAGEREDRWKAKGQAAIVAEYRAYVKAPNACRTEDWPRYKLASGFDTLAKNASVPTPWDAAFGSEYARRKMSPDVPREEVWSIYWTYVGAMPEPAMAMHETHPAHSLEQKDVFNEMIRRDVECFRKLK